MAKNNNKNSWIYMGVAFVSIMGISTVATAQTSKSPHDVTAAMFACKNIAASEERLACFDTAVGLFEDASKSGEVITMVKPEVEKIKKEAFGFNIPSLFDIEKIFGGSKKESASDTLKKDKKKKSKREKVILQIASIQKISHEKYRYIFDNGQVWEQRDRVKTTMGKRAKEAHIVKASMGSYLMRINGKGKAIRVRRVK